MPDLDAALRRTSKGLVRGRVEEGLASFKGVPFAEPPVSSLRFRTPVAAAPWAGSVDCAGPGVAAPQVRIGRSWFGNDGLSITEDCLQATVWSPGSPGDHLPVMVWIHGGGFTAGGACAPLNDGARLARHGKVVVVGLNYRLGALGFMSVAGRATDNGDVHANFGVLDVLLGLEWVRDEIANFGGDPGNVTVFGVSAGSMLIAALLSSPRAHGLFHRAILESGVDSENMRSSTAEKVTAAWLDAAGLPPDADLKSMQDLPLDTVLNATRWIQERGVRKGLRFGICADGEVVPIRRPEEGPSVPSSKVDLLIGTTRDEFRLFAADIPRSDSLDETELARRLNLLLRGRLADQSDAGEAAVKYYASLRSDKDIPSLYSAIVSDVMFRVPSIRLAERHHAAGGRTFMYLFTQESPLEVPVLGACHGLDVPFVFGTLDAAGAAAGTGPDQRKLSEGMQEAWTAFARSGDPSTEILGAWPEYTPESRASMVLGPDGRVVNGPMNEEYEFWRGKLR
jgi:para-nitrobenzyl esterase